MSPILDVVGQALPLDLNSARRLFHGRGGRWPGYEHLTVDHYGDLLLINQFNPPGQEYEGIERALADLLQAQGVRACLVQQRYARPAAAYWAWGEAAEEWLFKEGGQQFHIRPGINRNPGFFLDMAPGREWLQTHAKGSRVLNLFAYSGSFSVYAFAGGARHVVNVDMSRGALNMARRNHQLNGFTTRDGYAAEFEKLEIFRSMGRIRRKGPYDILVVDPPSFQPGSFIVNKDYPRLLRKLQALSAPGARWLLCLNAPELDGDWLLEQVSRSCEGVDFVERLQVASGFENADPERGLKALVFRVPD